MPGAGGRVCTVNGLRRGGETATIATMVAPGELIAGKYRVDRVLGEGGMGVVVLARHEQLEQQVALKFLHVSKDLPPDAMNRFLREARAVAKLRGENVARVLDVDTLPDGSPYIVMEYLQGQDLSEVVDERALPVSEAVDFVLQACVGLAEAHALGIVHRDLKPANLFLTRTPDGTPLVKVLDFGVSKLRSEDEPSMPTTQTGTVMGSPLYMPPEQARSSRNVDHRADIWALGAVLYQLVTRHPPFTASNIADLFVRILHEPHAPASALVPDAPAPLDAIVDRCLAKTATERYADLAELALALEPLASADGARSVAKVLRLSGRATDPGAEAAPRNTTSVPVVVKSAAAVSDGPTQSALSVTDEKRPPRRVWTYAAALAIIVVVALGARALLSAEVDAAERNATPTPEQAAAVPPPARSLEAPPIAAQLTAPVEPAADAGPPEPLTPVVAEPRVPTRPAATAPTPKPAPKPDAPPVIPPKKPDESAFDTMQ